MQADWQLACDGWLKALCDIAVLVEEYLVSLEPNWNRPSFVEAV